MPNTQFQSQALDANLIQNQVIQEKIELFDQTNSTISQKSGGSRSPGDNDNVMLAQQFFEP